MLILLKETETIETMFEMIKPFIRYYNIFEMII